MNIDQPIDCKISYPENTTKKVITAIFIRKSKTLRKTILFENLNLQFFKNSSRYQAITITANRYL